MHIAVLESLAVGAEELKSAMEPFVREGHTFSVYERTSDLSVLRQEMQGAQAVILANMPLPEAALSAASELRFIDIAFTGTDHVAVDYAHRRGIKVSNASGYSTGAVSELALALALAVYRHIPAQDRAARSGRDKTGLMGQELSGKTVGIVGTGKIGLRSAALFRALGCRVIGTSRHCTGGERSGIAHMPLEDLLRQSDLVLLHCPLTEETRGLIGERALRCMKKSAVLINVARGPVVDTAALYEALKTGKIAGAGIDVFDTEPPLDPSSDLVQLPNVVLTPHSAYFTQEAMQQRLEIVFGNLRAFLEGRMENEV